MLSLKIDLKELGMIYKGHKLIPFWTRSEI